MIAVVITTAITVLAAFLAFAFLGAALWVVGRFGKVRGRCACKRAEEVLARIDAQHKSSTTSTAYHPATVNTGALPQIFADDNLL